MTRDKMELEREPESRPTEPCPARKPYRCPQLEEWGSIVELTGGPAGDVTDVDGGGSQPF